MGKNQVNLLPTRTPLERRQGVRSELVEEVEVEVEAPALHPHLLRKLLQDEVLGEHGLPNPRSAL